MVFVASSILSADFSKLGLEIQAIDKAGSDWIHIDVMDGHYVPNLTFGMSVIKSLRPWTAKPFDVHLMIEPVQPLLGGFIAAGANRITFHPDAELVPSNVIDELKRHNVSAGLALSPNASLDVVEDFLDEIDLLLIMTVEPGFGGQSFMHDMLEKIERASAMIKASGRDIYLQVDGGITVETSALVKKAGADVLVAGSAVFEGGSTKYSANIRDLKES